MLADHNLGAPHGRLQRDRPVNVAGRATGECSPSVQLSHVVELSLQIFRARAPLFSRGQ